MPTSTNTMYRVRQVATGVAGSPYYLTGYFDASLSTGQTAANAWRACIGPAVGTFVQPYVYLPITSVDLVNPVDGNTIGVENVSVPQLSFTSTDDPLPPSTSLLLRWRTGIYADGRELRGRTNIARLGETANSGGVVDPASVTAWQTRCTSLITSGTASFVVWSPKHGYWAKALSAGPSAQWAVLRSRRD